MKLKQSIKTILLLCGIITLTACSSTQHRSNAQIADANAGYASDLRSSAATGGLGQEPRFNEAGGMNKQSLSRRVYYFDFDSPVVHDADKPAIYANANYLIAHPRAKVMLEGHTDPRGSREYNVGLGERRAKAVADVLMGRGVNPKQIRVVSYGAEKLAVPGHTEADYQLDRRVVLVYLQQ
jgi:peptidoglycan-associated lipoprotein